MLGIDSYKIEAGGARRYTITILLCGNALKLMGYCCCNCYCHTLLGTWILVTAISIIRTGDHAPGCAVPVQRESLLLALIKVAISAGCQASSGATPATPLRELVEGIPEGVYRSMRCRPSEGSKHGNQSNLYITYRHTLSWAVAPTPKRFA